ncbi:MAG: DUF2760 domain-containing protein [Burkholderiaceae bacterium]|jgi:hypothetical protein|nr:DUF2760 domain-containing protein [Burkholderiaceae bacterium]
MGFAARLSAALRSFFALLFSGCVPDDVLDRFRPAQAAAAAPVAAPPASAPADEGDRAVQLLALLQRDGRLVDFLLEDIAAYTDAQVGIAARDVNASCRAALARYLTLQPVCTAAEGTGVAVDEAGDPARVKLVGAVSANVRQGIVRHRGWQVVRIALPPLPRPEDRRIVAPAEVEVA